jgi:DMSO/TMAO reductase YedYZ molybdopterin-dependent catalytic subunit
MHVIVTPALADQERQDGSYRLAQDSSAEAPSPVITIRHARVVQKVGEFMMWPFNVLTEWWDPNSQLAEKDISPYFWPNGTMPKSAEFDTLVAEGFARFVLRVDGLVESPRVFSYAGLKAMPKQEQITTPAGLFLR